MISDIVQLYMKSVIEESSYNQEECTNKLPQINIIITPLNEMSFMTDSQLDSTIIANKAVLKDGPIIRDIEKGLFINTENIPIEKKRGKCRQLKVEC